MSAQTTFIFNLIGGTALLMYGVDKLGENLEKASGNVMKKILSVLTGRLMSAFAIGTILTAIVQSSTAITVLTVGFVNAGLMSLSQAIGIIYGANIGTTITAQIFAASYTFKLTTYALPVLGIGFLINYMAKKPTIKNVGAAIMGFGMMFQGLALLNSGKDFLSNSPSVKYFFDTYATIPIVGILLGITVTALIHSSSATVALVMVLGQAGLLGSDPTTALRTAICIMLGDNIGTCVTAQLASLTANINARRAAWAHTLYNVIGVLLAWVSLPWFVLLIQRFTSLFMHSTSLNVQIANSHTVFNVLSAVIFIPFTKYYVHFLETIIRDNKKDHGAPVYLDRLLLDTPVAAFKATVLEILRGTEISRRMIADVMKAIQEHNKDILEEVEKDEAAVNRIQKDTIHYTVELSQHSLNNKMSELVPVMINSVNNIERIGDHAVNLTMLTKSYIDNKLQFSTEALAELQNVYSLIEEMFDSTIRCLQEDDMTSAYKTMELEGRVDELCKQMQSGHIHRLEAGECTIESGIIYLDIVSYLERVADHICKVSTIRASSISSFT
jgi:phosphate:Na+ symporter